MPDTTPVASWALYIGPAAGVSASLLWTATSLLLTAASKRLSAAVANAGRIGLAVVLLAVTFRLSSGHWIPELSIRQMILLGLSGILGLSIGDQALLTAFLDIGPRLSLLVMTTSPLMAAILGWVFLGETLSVLAMAGIALTLGGVAWVILERPATTIGPTSPHRARGLALSVVGALCQAGGLLLTKEGMGHGWLPAAERLGPQAATLVRMVFAGAGMIPVLWLHARRERERRAASAMPRHSGSIGAGVWFAVGGSILGPYLGVWMSLVAADRCPLGVAQTLCSLSPIFILPCVAVIHGEHVSPRAVFGAVVAVAGSALLFVRTG